MTRLLLALATLLAAVAILATPAHAAVVVCDGGTCNGTDKPDQITGSPVADDIYGRGGSDEITDVDSVGDRIQGGGGGDTITSKDGAGDDIEAGGGSDTIDMRDGSTWANPDSIDSVNCGDGTDTVYADPDDIVSQANCENVTRGS